MSPIENPTFLQRVLNGFPNTFYGWVLWAMVVFFAAIMTLGITFMSVGFIFIVKICVTGNGIVIMTPVNTCVMSVLIMASGLLGMRMGKDIFLGLSVDFQKDMFR